MPEGPSIIILKELVLPFKGKTIRQRTKEMQKLRWINF